MCDHELCRSFFLLQSSRVRVDILLYENKSTDKREQYNGRAGKNWTGCPVLLYSPKNNKSVLTGSGTFWHLFSSGVSQNYGDNEDLVQIFFSPPVVLLSIISWFALVRYSMLTLIRLDWRKNLDGIHRCSRYPARYLQYMDCRDWLDGHFVPSSWSIYGPSLTSYENLHFQVDKLLYPNVLATV